MKQSSSKKTGSPKKSTTIKKKESVKVKSIKVDKDVKTFKDETPVLSTEEQLVLCFKSWTINTAFVSATFATLLGLSMSFLMVVAYNILERYESNINPRAERTDDMKSSLENIMYITGIGAWSVWAWVFAYLILFIVFIIPQSPIGYWILWIAYMLCGLIILITSSMVIARLNKFTTDFPLVPETDHIITAKYICTVAIFISTFFIFFIMTVGLTFLLGTDKQVVESLKNSMNVEESKSSMKMESIKV